MMRIYIYIFSYHSLYIYIYSLNNNNTYIYIYSARRPANSENVLGVYEQFI